MNPGSLAPDLTHFSVAALSELSFFINKGGIIYRPPGPGMSPVERRHVGYLQWHLGAEHKQGLKSRDHGSPYPPSSASCSSLVFGALELCLQHL